LQMRKYINEWDLLHTGWFKEPLDKNLMKNSVMFKKLRRKVQIYYMNKLFVTMIMLWTEEKNRMKI
jgi:hypothetical protein